MIEAKVGNNSIGEVKKDLSSRGIVTEIPAPTYGYMRRDDFYVGTIDENRTSEWVAFSLRGMIYADRRGRNMGRIRLSAKYFGEEQMRYVRVDGI